MRKQISASVLFPLCASLVLAFSACSSSAGSSPQASAATRTAGTALQEQVTDKATAIGAASQAGSAASSPEEGAAAALSGQKIIEHLSYQIESTEFDASVSHISALCTQLGGYVQDSSIGGVGIRSENALRSASFSLRIPQEKLVQFKSSAGSIGNILNFSSSSENIGEQYYDTEARLKSLRAQQDRLLALMQKSGSLADVVALEKALADVNYQIEQLTGTLRQYDSLISYSTVSVQLNEVIKPTKVEKEPATLGGRIARQFLNSLRALGNFGESLLVFLLGGAPILLLLAAVAAGGVWLCRFHRKHRLAGVKKSAPAPEKAGETQGEDPPKADP